MTVEDVHGCSLTSGHTWCEAQRRCISEFEICDAGTWDAGACVYEWAGLSWDLTPLQRAEHYVVEDVQAQSDTKYVIGMCRGIDPLEIAPACNVTTGSALEKLTGFSPAYQVMDGGTQCYRCGGEYVGPEGAAQHVSAGLLNLQAPAAGIFLKYDGGNTCETGSPTTRDACDAEVNGRNYCRRSMQINLICNDHISSVPFLEQITEESGCAYSVTLNSEYGCPRECPRAEGMVCHNRGICGYDGLEAGRTVGGGNGVARCLCAAPWGGPSCSEPLAERVVVVAVAAAHGALYYVGLSTLGFGLALVLCSRKLRYLVRDTTGVPTKPASPAFENALRVEGAPQRIQRFTATDPSTRATTPAACQTDRGKTPLGKTARLNSSTRPSTTRPPSTRPPSTRPSSTRPSCSDLRAAPRADICAARWSCRACAASLRRARRLATSRRDNSSRISPTTWRRAARSSTPILRTKPTTATAATSQSPSKRQRTKPNNVDDARTNLKGRGPLSTGGPLKSRRSLVREPEFTGALRVSRLCCSTRRASGTTKAPTKPRHTSRTSPVLRGSELRGKRSVTITRVSYSVGA